MLFRRLDFLDLLILCLDILGKVGNLGFGLGFGLELLEILRGVRLERPVADFADEFCSQVHDGVASAALARRLCGLTEQLRGARCDVFALLLRRHGDLTDVKVCAEGVGAADARVERLDEAAVVQRLVDGQQRAADAAHDLVQDAARLHEDVQKRRRRIQQLEALVQKVRRACLECGVCRRAHCDGGRRAFDKGSENPARPAVSRLADFCRHVRGGLAVVDHDLNRIHDDAHEGACDGREGSKHRVGQDEVRHSVCDGFQNVRRDLRRRKVPAKPRRSFREDARVLPALQGGCCGRARAARVVQKQAERVVGRVGREAHDRGWEQGSQCARRARQGLQDRATELERAFPELQCQLAAVLEGIHCVLAQTRGTGDVVLPRAPVQDFTFAPPSAIAASMAATPTPTMAATAAALTAFALVLGQPAACNLLLMLSTLHLLLQLLQEQASMAACLGVQEREQRVCCGLGFCSAPSSQGLGDSSLVHCEVSTPMGAQTFVTVTRHRSQPQPPALGKCAPFDHASFDHAAFSRFHNTLHGVCGIP